MKEELTRERALELHRKMWTCMQTELGDNPTSYARIKFKRDWCKEHGFDDVDCHCFLCEYSKQTGSWCASECLIDWSPLACEPGEYSMCTDEYKGGGEIYEAAPISEILALPERSFEDERE